MSSNGIFLNYRREDEGGYAGRLFDRLEQTFSGQQLFMDVEGQIKAGQDYADVLRAQVARCDVFLAIIGPRWLTVSDSDGRRRIDNAADWVRLEIVAALNAGTSKRVIPVLIGNAAMPRAEDLPVELAPLATKQAAHIRIDRFNADAKGLIEQVRHALSELDKERATRLAEIEAEQQQSLARQAEEEARRSLAELRARERDFAKLSQEDIRRIEEVASWDYARESDNIGTLRAHISRFPNGYTRSYAIKMLEQSVWKRLSDSPDIPELKIFLAEFPDGEFAQIARDKLANAERKKNAEAERIAWTRIGPKPNAKQLHSFLKEYPRGNYSQDALNRLSLINKAWRKHGFSIVAEHIFISFITLVLLGLVVGVLLYLVVGFGVMLENTFQGAKKSEADIIAHVRIGLFIILGPIALYRAYRLLVIIIRKEVDEKVLE